MRAVDTVSIPLLATSRIADHLSTPTASPPGADVGASLSLPNLIGQTYFDCSLDGKSIRSVGFGQITLGRHRFDERTGYIDAEMLQALRFAAAVLPGSLGGRETARAGRWQVENIYGFVSDSRNALSAIKGA